MFLQCPIDLCVLTLNTAIIGKKFVLQTGSVYCPRDMKMSDIHTGVKEFDDWRTDFRT